MKITHPSDWPIWAQTVFLVTYVSLWLIFLVGGFIIVGSMK